MTLDTNAWLFIWGGGLILLALLIWWRTGRHDIKGAAMDSAWQIARGKRTAENLTPIEMMAGEIGAEATHFGKARRTVFTVIAHFVAQALSFLAYFILLGGLILIGLAWYWS
jgi:hypothetical protein